MRNKYYHNAGVLSGNAPLTCSLLQLRHLHLLPIQIDLHCAMFKFHNKWTNPETSCWTTNSKEILRDLNWFFISWLCSMLCSIVILPKLVCIA